LASGIAVYVEVLELLENILCHDKDFALHENCILDAIRIGKGIFDKYHKLMDENPLYTIIAILDPRVKGTWI
jgi:hypothetical protein